MTAPIHQPQDNEPRWTAQTVGMSLDILDRMERAVAKVRERLLRATAALNQARRSLRRGRRQRRCLVGGDRR